MMIINITLAFRLAEKGHADIKSYKVWPCLNNILSHRLKLFKNREVNADVKLYEPRPVTDFNEVAFHFLELYMCISQTYEHR